MTFWLSLGRVFYLDPGDAGVEDGGGAVGDGKFVVLGRDAAPLLVEGEGAFDDVAILVCVRVEGGWSATAAPSPFAGADLVAFLWDHRRDSAASQPTADHTTGVALSAKTASGRVRGLPPPGRGTRISARTCSNMAPSWRWPPVTTTARGLPWPSTA